MAKKHTFLATQAPPFWPLHFNANGKYSTIDVPYLGRYVPFTMTLILLTKLLAGSDDIAKEISLTLKLYSTYDVIHTSSNQLVAILFNLQPMSNLHEVSYLLHIPLPARRTSPLLTGSAHTYLLSHSWPAVRKYWLHSTKDWAPLLKSSPTWTPQTIHQIFIYLVK